MALAVFVAKAVVNLRRDFERNLVVVLLVGTHRRQGSLVVVLLQRWFEFEIDVLRSELAELVAQIGKRRLVINDINYFGMLVDWGLLGNFTQNIFDLLANIVFEVLCFILTLRLLVLRL